MQQECAPEVARIQKRGFPRLNGTKFLWPLQRDGRCAKVSGSEGSRSVYFTMMCRSCRIVILHTDFLVPRSEAFRFLCLTGRLKVK